MIFKNEETNIQVAVVNYLRARYPQALFTIAPSGMKLPIHVARMLKAMGYVAGTPDLMIFEPRGEYHGLFIEIKTERGRASEAQGKFMDSLWERGYLVALCFGYERAVKVIDSYLVESCHVLS